MTEVGLTQHHPEYILVIDESPLIAVGMQEVLRSINPAARIEYTSSVFTALSAKEFDDRAFVLIILGAGLSDSSEHLLRSATELKQRFIDCRILVYTDQYDPILIRKIMDGDNKEEKFDKEGKINKEGKLDKEGKIDACVHKFEPLDEIRNAFLRLPAGEVYVSPILHTLYYTYRLNIEK
jgi:hypothetical protein